LLVIFAAHSLVSFVFLHSDEFSQIKVAGERGFFNKLLVALPDIEDGADFHFSGNGVNQVLGSDSHVGSRTL
jgi:hypothetical protein